MLGIRSLLEKIKQMQMQNSMKNNFEASDIEPMITYGTNPGMD
jgi:hypothetical protein